MDFFDQHGAFRIGREASSNLFLADERVSRRHASIVYEDDRFVLYDHGSANGTRVGGGFIHRHALKDGDAFRIDDSRIVFHHAGSRGWKSEPKPLASSSDERINALKRVPKLHGFELSFHDKGGASRIYKAVRQRDGWTAAVKLLTEPEPAIRDRFPIEAEILQRLEHPNIVKAYHAGPVADTFYFMLEFCEGGNLRDRLQMLHGRPMAVSEAVRIVGQACSALSYAYSTQQNIVHRDIKPENILFDADGVVHICDFGIAKLTGLKERTVTEVILGTSLYMAPEHSNGGRVDHRTDIYSLGVVLYEMLVGHPPFDGSSEEVRRLHRDVMPPAPCVEVPSIPTWLSNATMTALEKYPAVRFQTAEDFARAIHYRMSAPPPDREQPGAARVAGMVLEVLADGNRIHVDEDETILRRDEVAPGDELMSRQHAVVAMREGALWIRDLGSTNGTFINGARIFEDNDWVPLNVDDELRLGHTEVRVRR